tara:strand:- start:268 stop:678 length:411 start_codon:yes stop_codon:yes gene_type:complete
MRLASLGAVSLATLTKCKVTDRITHQCPVETVILAGNDIGDEGASCMAELFRKNPAITECDLSWNNIKKAGAVAIFQAIPMSKISSLDLGYNALGTSTDLERVATLALSKLLLSKSTSHLIHLNISHNHLNEKDCR